MPPADAPANRPGAGYSTGNPPPSLRSPAALRLRPTARLRTSLRMPATLRLPVIQCAAPGDKFG